MLAYHRTYLNKLRAKLSEMSAKDRDFMLAHYDILTELPENEFAVIMSVYISLLKINGMSEISAFETLIKMARKSAISP